MKTTIENARKVLAEAELRLRNFIGEAAQTADYDAVRRLSLTAERLLALGSELNGAVPITSEHVHSVPARTSRRARRTASPSTRPSKGDYPRYERHGESLWRVGWSKKARQEYVHKAPRDSYDRIVAALVALGKTDRSLITVERIMKHVGQVDGAEIPAYHVYVTLGLLGKLGYVEKQGRDGYRVVAEANLAPQAGPAWDGVAEES